MCWLTIWSGQKWQQVWVERSENFFPPEWQQIADTTELAWQYPIYRSNDTYQWVYLADQLALGNTAPLNHRSDEGLENGRANAWHSGLAHLLSLSGQIYANQQKWPAERGIHATAHWLGPCLFIPFTLIGAYLLFKVTRSPQTLFLIPLTFFNPLISWDFAYSRLDHDIVFHTALLLQLCGLFAIILKKHWAWALIAGFGAALGWWANATIQTALSLISIIALTAACWNLGNAPRKALITWGVSSISLTLIFAIYDQVQLFSPTFTALHAVHLAAQAGACLTVIAATQTTIKSKSLYATIALLIGTAPLYWISIYGNESHIWFDPFMRRLHTHIVEFQSPLTNGNWKHFGWLFTVSVALSLIGYNRFKSRPATFLTLLLTCLFVLSCYQTRWSGLFALAVVFSISSLAADRKIPYSNILLTILSIACASHWLSGWKSIETKPGREFVADIILQVGARDMALNTSRLNQLDQHDTTSKVLMPYGFAPTAALFKDVHPIGTFYWENHQGLKTATELLSTKDDSAAQQLIKDHSIKYILVQRQELGNPFAQLNKQVTQTEGPLELNLAWRLSNAVHTPSWATELPFYGSFDPSKFSVRIYRVK